MAKNEKQQKKRKGHSVQDLIGIYSLSCKKEDVKVSA